MYVCIEDDGDLAELLMHNGNVHVCMCACMYVHRTSRLWPCDKSMCVCMYVGMHACKVVRM